jgi:hypothetical protein
VIRLDHATLDAFSVPDKAVLVQQGRSKPPSSQAHNTHLVESIITLAGTARGQARRADSLHGSVKRRDPRLETSGWHDGKKSKLLDIRAGRYVCLEGEGLVILGCIGNELLTYAPDDWRKYVNALGRINWQESDPLWTSSIRQRRDQVDPKTNQTVTVYKKLSAYSAVNTAIEAVRKIIDWPKPDPLEARTHLPEAPSETADGEPDVLNPQAATDLNETQIASAVQ